MDYGELDLLPILLQIINIIKRMTTIEEDLIMNNIPYPKYYNGYDWNTVIVSERKYIPKYLHSDLPSLRHTQIR
jgi:hypothetical protein